MLKTIKALIPNKIKNVYRKQLQKHFRKEYNKFSRIFKKERHEAEKNIPAVDLQQKHIGNLKMILNRRELLSLIPQNAVCAEIGVNEGEFSELILNVTKPQKLHLIDAWGDPDRYHDGLKLLVEEKFEREVNEKTVEINLGFSTDVLGEMPDAYFDWVYLDTEHIYSTTAKELKILNGKMKAGGIICGHDYIIGNWADGIRYGVVEAVHEFCLEAGWELLYLTVNKNESPSFAIRRL